MNPRVLRRFIILLGALTVGVFLFWEFFNAYISRPPGDHYAEVGTLRLEDDLYDEALENYALALEEQPNHRGALMGRALVFIKQERYDDAIAELDHLIDFLQGSLEPDDTTGIGALAAAYANRGIVYDRRGEYEMALESYIQALKVDEGAVEGPGLVHKILYGSEKVSNVRDRARYIHEQLKLPEEERLMRVPEIDARQRMHKP